eukprot:gene26127-14605_t
MAKLLKGISSKVSLTLGDWQQGQTEQQLGAEDDMAGNSSGGAALLNAEVVATTPTPTPGLELGGGMPVAGFAFGSDTKEVANVKDDDISGAESDSSSFLDD